MDCNAQIPGCSIDQPPEDLVWPCDFKGDQKWVELSPLPDDYDGKPREEQKLHENIRLLSKVEEITHHLQKGAMGVNPQ